MSRDEHFTDWYHKTQYEKAWVYAILDLTHARWDLTHMRQAHSNTLKKFIAKRIEFQPDSGRFSLRKNSNYTFCSTVLCSSSPERI